MKNNNKVYKLNSSILFCKHCNQFIKDFPKVCPDCKSSNLNFDENMMDLVCLDCGFILDLNDYHISRLNDFYSIDERKSFEENDNITDEEILYSLVLNHDSVKVIKKACEKLSSNEYLAKIALYHENVCVRKIAFKKVNLEEK